MSKSKSRTFNKESEFSEVIDWFIENIETTDREVIHNSAEPSMDVVVETNYKYTVTITKIDDSK